MNDEALVKRARAWLAETFVDGVLYGANSTRRVVERLAARLESRNAELAESKQSLAKARQALADVRREVAWADCYPTQVAALCDGRDINEYDVAVEIAGIVDEAMKGEQT